VDVVDSLLDGLESWNLNELVFFELSLDLLIYVVLHS
jgi:hypothetical protein